MAEQRSKSSNSKGKQKADGQVSVSQTDKAIAACTGAVAVSLLMTPFDVIKTRLQTQPPVSNPKLFIPDPHLSASSSSSNRASSSSSSSSRSTSRPTTTISAAHPATCCQQTFFTTNSHSSTLLCRFDPRGIPITINPSSITSSSSSTSIGNLVLPQRSGSQPFLPQSSTSTSTKVSEPRIKIRAQQNDCAFPNEKEATKALKSLNEKANENRLKGLWDGVIKVGRGEGVRGLWRGLSPTLMMTVPSQVTYMTAYDHLRTFFLCFEIQSNQSLKISDPSNDFSPSLSNVSTHQVFSTLLAGGIARAISATLVTPLELLRTRLQSSTSTSSKGRSGVLMDLIREVKTSPEGVRILYRGLAPTLARDVPFSAIYFAGYESMKRGLTGNGLGESSNSNQTAIFFTKSSNNEGNGNGLEEFMVAFISGATSGSIAALVTHPFDVVKTRLQSHVTNPNTSTTSQGHNSKTLTSSLRSTRISPWKTLTTLIKNEGVAGMFSGLSPRIAKIAPACGIMIASFEIVGRTLADRKGDVLVDGKDVWIEGEELGAR